MRRRWIADTFSPTTGHPTHAALTGERAAHLAKVLRAQTGQSFDVVANGFLHRAEITSVTVDRVEFILQEELESDAALPLHLYLAIFKFDHFEWAIEKATELGVAHITPILARRTEKHLGSAAAKRVERWRRIAHEAAQQSRRASVPAIDDPSSLMPVLQAAAFTPIRILLSEIEQQVSLQQAFLRASAQSPTPRPIALAIGPEGGWTAEEMTLFAAHHWTPATLGPRILRAETAAIAALAILGSLLG